jgi:tripartite-type tricarboxylate transporter receptor subunit TctC
MDNSNKEDALNTTRRRLLAGGLAATAAGMLPAARADDEPTNIIVPFTAGGPTDIMARVIGQNLQAIWGGSVIVQNKAGAGGSIGANYVARSKPDGKTMLLAASSHVMTRTLLDLPYDPVKDFTVIAPVAYQPHILCVLASDPVKDFPGFLAELKAKPGQMTIGSAGIGNASHLASLLLAAAVKASVVQVPYSGSSQLNTALLGGQVRATFMNPTVADPLIKAGNIRALGVAAKERWREYPNVPTIAEMGFPGFEALAWYVYLGPKNVPQKTADRIYKDIHTVLEKAEVRKVILNSGLDLLELSPAAFAKVMKADNDKWAKILRDAGLAKS